MGWIGIVGLWVGAMTSGADQRLELPRPDYRAEPSDPEWLRQAVQLHGHLGPAMVAGVRMGLAGLRAVGAQGYFDVEVSCTGPLARPPQSCLLDGVQIATGATLGKRNLHSVEAEALAIRVRNTKTGKMVEVRPTEKLLKQLGAFRPRPGPNAELAPPPAEHGRSDAALAQTARKIATMPEAEIVSVIPLRGEER